VSLDRASFDTGLILADEAAVAPAPMSPSAPVAPIWYSREANCEIGPDSSISLMGGFCKGSQKFLDGGMEFGTKTSYEYASQAYAAQCTDCEFRQDLPKLKADIAKHRKPLRF
jgi:hypothetical protein